MAYSVELVGQKIKKGKSPSGSSRWEVYGTDSKELAYSLIHAASPAIWSGLVKQNIDVDEVGNGEWKGLVQYGVMEMGEEGDTTWSFEVGTESFHITHGLDHVNSYVEAGTAPDHKGAIGVRKDGSGVTIEGCDILIPTFHWDETYYAAYETVASHSFITLLENTVGKINSATWRIWAKGELLLLGVSGSKRGEEPVALTYSFASSRTKTDLTIGDITGVTKEGNDYLWIEYEKKEDNTANALTARPIAVHVERVYDYANFADLGLPDPWS